MLAFALQACIQYGGEKIANICDIHIFCYLSTPTEGKM